MELRNLGKYRGAAINLEEKRGGYFDYRLQLEEGKIRTIIIVIRARWEKVLLSSPSRPISAATAKLYSQGRSIPGYNSYYYLILDYN